MLLDHDEPTNFEEAMMSPNSAKWLEAMKSEMGSMYENKVWTLVDLPNDRKSIPMMPTPTREEANDNDHETLDQVTTKPRRSTRA